MLQIYGPESVISAKSPELAIIVPTFNECGNVVPLLEKIERWIPARFVLFMAIGGLGVFVHMGVLAFLLQAADASFVVGQSIAIVVAMTFNFFLNNALTYRDKRLRGFWRVLGGLFSFYLVCSLGTLSNVGIANALFSRDYSWVVSGIAGIFVGAVWNYAASSVFTWREKKIIRA